MQSTQPHLSTNQPTNHTPTHTNTHIFFFWWSLFSWLISSFVLMCSQSSTFRPSSWTSTSDHLQSVIVFYFLSNWENVCTALGRRSSPQKSWRKSLHNSMIRRVLMGKIMCVCVCVWRTPSSHVCKIRRRVEVVKKRWSSLVCHNLWAHFGIYCTSGLRNFPWMKIRLTQRDSLRLTVSFIT